MTDAKRIRTVVGLRYRPEAGLPQVVVKGAGAAANDILGQSANLGGPPVVRDPDLAEQLFRLPMDGHIGPELFEVVAVLLAHVLLLDQRKEATR